MAEALKTCSACKVNRVLNLFYKDKNRVDGYNPYCKICEKNRDKLRHNHNRQLMIMNSNDSINWNILKTTKMCKQCNQEKEFINFYKEKRNKDGYRKICKNCYNVS